MDKNNKKNVTDKNARKRNDGDDGQSSNKKARFEEASAADVAARLQTLHNNAALALEAARRSHAPPPPPPNNDLLPTDEDADGNREADETTMMKNDIANLKTNMEKMGTDLFAFMTEMRELMANDAREGQQGGRTPSMRGEGDEVTLNEDSSGPPAFPPPAPNDFFHQQGEQQRLSGPSVQDTSSANHADE